MTSPSRNLRVYFTADTSDLGRGADEAHGKLSSVAMGLKDILTAGAAVAAFNFFKTTIQQASDLGETTSKVGVIFGKDAAAQIEKFGASADKSLGQSRRSAMDASATFATFGKQAGLAGDELVSFSTRMVTLASDMASFSNTTPDEALEAIGAALRGESEPIMRYGVLLNEATLQQRGFAMGLIRTTSDALTPQQRVLAVQAEILAQTSDAQGDFARTSGGLANQQRILTAQWENLTAKVGGAFLPAVTKTVTFLNDNLVPTAKRVEETLGDIGSVVMPLVKTLGGFVSDLARGFDALPDPLQAGALAFLAWRLAGTGATGAVGSAFSAVKDTVTTATTGIGVAALDLRDAYTRGSESARKWAEDQKTLALMSGPVAGTLRGAAGEAQGFVASVGGLSSAVGYGLKNAVSGVVGLFGGPWGLALTAATIGVTSFTSVSAKAAERQRDLAAAGKEVAEAIAEQNGQITLSVRKTAAKVAEEKGLLKSAEQYGIASMSIVRAILNEGNSYDVVKGKLNEFIAAHKTQQFINDAWVESYDEQASAARQLLSDLDGLRGSKEGEIAASIRQAEAAGDTTDALSKQSAASGTTTTSTGLLSNAMAEVGLKFDSASSAGSQLVEVIKKLADEQAKGIESEEGYEKSLDDLTESIKENGATLDIHTEKGRSNRDALEEVATRIRDMTLADIESGVPAQEAIRRHDDRAKALLDEAIKAGMSRDEAEKLIGAYSRIPPNVRTVIDTQGYEEAWRKLQNLSSAQRNLELGIPIKEQQMGFTLDGLPRAEGGPIVGPGGPKSDVIPVWASNGEYMQQAAAVQYYGMDVMQALNNRQIPRDALKRAEGGPIGWPFKVNVSKTKIPELWSVLSAVNVGGSGVQRWAPLVLQALSMLGQPASLLPNVLRRMNQESGGNPMAINLWDSNAAAGIPSKGLMQTIDPTFNAYAGPFVGRGIWDPLANIYAGLNYAIHRYPSLQYAMDKPGGYRNGGWLKPGGLAFNETSKPEAVFNEEQLKKLASRGGDKHYHLTVVSASKSEADLRTEYRRMEWLEG